MRWLGAFFCCQPLVWGPCIAYRVVLRYLTVKSFFLGFFHVRAPNHLPACPLSLETPWETRQLVMMIAKRQICDSEDTEESNTLCEKSKDKIPVMNASSTSRRD
jgi:hypothetical protein